MNLRQILVTTARKLVPTLDAAETTQAKQLPEKQHYLLH